MYLTVNSKYNPFTYDELIKPLQDQALIYNDIYKLSKENVDLAEKIRDNEIKEEERKQKYQDRIDQAAAAFGSLEQMVGDEYDWDSLNLSWGDKTGKDAWNAQYQDALNALQNNPWDPETFRKIGGLYSTYQQSIAPALVQQTYERDKRDKEEQIRQQQEFQSLEAAKARDAQAKEAQLSRDAENLKNKQAIRSALLPYAFAGVSKEGLTAIENHIFNGDSLALSAEDLKAAGAFEVKKKGKSGSTSADSGKIKLSDSAPVGPATNIETKRFINLLQEPNSNIYFGYRGSGSYNSLTYAKWNGIIIKGINKRTGFSGSKSPFAYSGEEINLNTIIEHGLAKHTNYEENAPKYLKYSEDEKNIKEAMEGANTQIEKEKDTLKIEDYGKTWIVLQAEGDTDARSGKQEYMIIANPNLEDKYSDLEDFQYKPE